MNYGIYRKFRIIIFVPINSTSRFVEVPYLKYWRSMRLKSALCGIRKRDYYCYTTFSTHIFVCVCCRGWTAIVNDDLLSRVFLFGTICMSALCGLAGLIAGSIANLYLSGSLSNSAVLYLGLGGFAVGLVLALGISSIMQGGVWTVFVCLAESPEALRNHHPKEYATLTDTWMYMHPASSPWLVSQGV